jgi:alpha-1,6-mannosyltransferase
MVGTMTPQPQLPGLGKPGPAVPDAVPVPVLDEMLGSARLGPLGRLTARAGRPRRRPLLLGLAGSLTLSVGALGAGGVLRHDPVLGNTPLAALRFGHGYAIAVLLSYLGLAGLVWAWMLLGRDVLARRVGGRAVLSSTLVWLVPIVVSPPLFTRDPYSYLAYGALPLHGFDPYAVGPSAMSGPISANVHWFWQDTPGMYGPLFIAIAKAVVSVTGDNVIAGVIGIRLAILLGLVPLVAALPGLCRWLGGRPAMALWLVVANPVTVVLLVGGPHDDLLVIGFLAAGALLTLNRKHAAGIALVTLAVAIKATAALALPFLVLVWAARQRGSRPARIAQATAAGVAVFVAVFGACSAAAGVGLGWLPALNAPTNVVSWLSLPTGVGQLAFELVSTLFGGTFETPYYTVTRVLGALLFLYLALRHWLDARDGGPDAVRRAGVVLLLFALLAPSTLPWYYTWGMVLLAGASWSLPRIRLVVVGSVFLIVSCFPDGEVALYAFGYLILTMAGAVLAAVALGRPDPLRLAARIRAGRRAPR